MFLLMKYSIDIRSMYEYDDILDRHCDALQRTSQRKTKLKDIAKEVEASNENLKGNEHKTFTNM